MDVKAVHGIGAEIVLTVNGELRTDVRAVPRATSVNRSSEAILPSVGLRNLTRWFTGIQTVCLGEPEPAGLPQ